MFEEYGMNRNNDWEKLENGTRIHKTALVAPWVRFDDNCVVYPYAIVGRAPSKSLALARNVSTIEANKIGARTIIGCYAIIYSDIVLGEDCLIGDHALIREGSRIGDKCVIGCHVSISYDSKIGDRNRFQNDTVFIGECGDDCFFGVGVICSSDNKIDLNNYAYGEFSPPKFQNKVMIGSGSNILPGVVIGSGAIIAAGSVVTKNVREKTIVMGQAAQEVYDSKPNGTLTYNVPHIQV